MTATAAMRALVDAGQFANLPGGFKAKGVRVVGDNDPIAPGEFKEVESTGIDLSKAIVPLPYKEPSSTLYQMLTFVAAAGQKFADSSEQVISDNASYGPVGTTMALLEASSKFFSAVHKRLHKSQKDEFEFRLLASIDYEYLPSKYPYEIPNANQQIFRKDFDGRVDVLPVSDPNIPSNAHRMMMAQMALQLAQNSPPGLFNLEALNRTILNSANMPNVEEILPPKQEPQKLDPVSDIMAATKGIPIAAFPGQDHDAHVTMHVSFLKLPIVQTSPQIMGVFIAHIKEHISLKARAMAQQDMQMQGMPMDQATLDAKIAQIEMQLTEAMMPNLMPQPQGPDPLVQIRQQELAIKQQQEQNKSQTDAERLNIERQKMHQLAVTDAARLE